MQEFILAMMLMFGGHEIGHEIEMGNQQIKGHYYSITPPAFSIEATPPQTARIMNAGFVYEDISLLSVSNTPFKTKAAGILALHKSIYLLRHDKDLVTVERSIPDSHIREIITATMLFDLYVYITDQTPKVFIHLDQSDLGVPMLACTIPL